MRLEPPEIKQKTTNNKNTIVLLTTNKYIGYITIFLFKIKKIKKNKKKSDAVFIIIIINLIWVKVFRSIEG